MAYRDLNEVLARLSRDPVDVFAEMEAARRAARQIHRAASVTRCRICQHPVHAHALLGGVRVCARSRDGGPPSCRECARLRRRRS
ncbi:hypothetical protein OHA74_54900 [Streptomyces phaeochromogenes]|uniref:hypothetical protein n=1 Tax=Streptomyces phaeochromogenes TaxID=1923 RepID=UPI002E2876F7|nr:hypothetical protein [Streptomyces phaeochromogenes]